VVHKLRGPPSNRRRSAEERERIVAILSAGGCPVRPTLAREHLGEKHQIKIGREALRQLMIQAGLWRARAASPKQCTRGVRGGASLENWCQMGRDSFADRFAVAHASRYVRILDKIAAALLRRKGPNRN